jgi:RNA polymerase sigma-70 factor (ECF subfamily)
MHLQPATVEPEGPPAGEIDWHIALAQHERWLRTVVAARVGERQAVEEVMQEVALAAVRQRAPLVDRSRLAPWLYRVAVRQSLLYRRRMGRRRNIVARYANKTQADESSSRSDDPLDWLVASERRQLIRTALARLPLRESELLLLKYTEGWSYQQIAAHLGTSVAAVESRLHRARGKLRGELAALDVIESHA